SDLNTIRSFTFATPQVVTAAQVFHMGMAQTANTVTGYFPVAAYSTPFVPGNIFYNTAAITGGTLTPLTANLGIFHFSGDFLGSCIGLGVNNVLPANNEALVYPNPVNNSVFVKLSAISGKAAVTVYNTLGQVVIEAKELTDNSAEINVSSLTKGIYILRITNGKEVSNTKIVVEH
ncbi:MAG TPA: T9SS type A sorting domain-containing protein, partial [Bacteroidia bacterium]|nr:T9SS type A sorting domain-containing protein [Bacteroidia bacterium]